MTNMTFFAAQKWAFSYAQKQGKTLEKSGVEMLLLGQMNWTLAQLLANFRTAMTQAQLTKFQANIKRYLAGEPPQYILQKANFFQRAFKVTPSTLIPRLETEELIEWILADLPAEVTGFRLADIGTGSGAIAVTLKLEQPALAVTATDISIGALQVAKENAAQLGAEVKFACGDLYEPLTGKYQIIVSNPPYIAEEEKAVIDESVINYEPHTALFAPNHGLALYEKLAEQLSGYLMPGGALYLEIGYQQGGAVKQLFAAHYPDATITLKQDMAGNDRMIKVQLPPCRE